MTYIIAEIGINHNGSMKLAKQLIRTAAKAGCNAVKFQKRNINSVYSKEELDTFSETLEEYKDHIDIVHGLERFYGDETLGNLLRHSKALVEECQSFQRLLRQEEEYAEEEE